MNLKRTAFVAALCASISLCQAAEHSTQEIQTIDAMAWDLHDVVFKHDKEARSLVFKNAPWKKLLYEDGAWKKNIKIIPKYAQFVFTKAPGDQYYAVAEKYEHVALQAFILRITACIKPIPETIALIQRIKATNPEFKNYLATNMGKQALAQARANFPDEFSLFETEHATLGEYTANSYCKKPGEKFFDRLVANIPHAKKILFIDDSAKNITAAVNHPSNKIMGLHFTGPEVLATITQKYRFATST